MPKYNNNMPKYNPKTNKKLAKACDNLRKDGVLEKNLPGVCTSGQLAQSTETSGSNWLKKKTYGLPRWFWVIVLPSILIVASFGLGSLYLGGIFGGSKPDAPVQGIGFVQVNYRDTGLKENFTDTEYLNVTVLLYDYYTDELYDAISVNTTYETTRDTRAVPYFNLTSYDFDYFNVSLVLEASEDENDPVITTVDLTRKANIDDISIDIVVKNGIPGTYTETDVDTDDTTLLALQITNPWYVNDSRFGVGYQLPYTTNPVNSWAYNNSVGLYGPWIAFDINVTAVTFYDYYGLLAPKNETCVEIAPNVFIVPYHYAATPYGSSTWQTQIDVHLDSTPIGDMWVYQGGVMNYANKIEVGA